MNEPTSPTPDRPADPPPPRDRFAWPLLALLMLPVVLVRLRLLATPLERDEGEYAYMGRLLLRGSPPFRDAVNMKLPGTNAAYAAIMLVFGQSPVGIHLGLLVSALATMTLLFLACRRIGGPAAGLAAAGAFGLMGMSFACFGFAAHATQFVTLAAAAALYVLARDFDRPTRAGAFLAGLFLGVAILLKQHALFFACFGLASVVLARRPAGRPARPILLDSFVHLLGIALPGLLLAALLLFTGDFSRFWFWTFTYASHYVRETPLSDAWQTFVASMKIQTREYAPLWIGAAIGLLLLPFSTLARPRKLLVLAFAAASAAAVVPGFYFRYHYFIVLYPAVGLLFALAIDTLVSRLFPARRNGPLAWLAPLVLVACCLWTLVTHRAYYWRDSPEGVVRFMYRLQPFADSPAMAARIRADSEPDDTVAVLGSEPQIPFLAQRRLATRQVYSYAMTEAHPFAAALQEEAIAEIERARPKFIVDCRRAQSWAITEKSPRRILEWADAYLPAHYEPVGTLLLLPDGSSRLDWSSPARPLPAQAAGVIVFRRRD